jgi:hypothetical protein
MSQSEETTAPVLIDTGDNGRPVRKPKLIREDGVVKKKRKKFNWGRLLDFEWEKPKEKVRFAITYLLTGLAFILASDIFQLVKLNTTAGFMVFIGILFMIAAIAVPIILLVKEDYERHNRY